VEPIVEVETATADSSDVTAEMPEGEMETQRPGIDPVCGMSVDPANRELRYELHAKTYYFCAAGCKASFDKDPHKYLGDTKSSPGGAGPRPNEVLL
jgi:YHS domain-containing protein